MEIKVFSSLDAMAKNKLLYCVRVDDPDSCPLDLVKSFFKAIYGVHCIVVVIFV